MAGMGPTPCRAMAAEDLRDVKLRARQGPRVTPAASPS
jgi:hypothetical protein